MATLLILVIFCGFIGLGIPDSLFGAAWPAIYSDLQFPISYANYITILISLCTVISSMMSGWINARFSAAQISIVSTLLTAIGLWGFSISNHLFFLCLFSLPLGLGAGAIDAALNHYTALHYSARAMSFLHCSYGVGVTVSPLILSFSLAGENGWRGGYQTAVWIQLAIVALFLLSLPLWNRAHPEQKSETQTRNERHRFSQLAKIPAFLPSVSLLFFSCALEFTCGTWGSTFLVETKHLPVNLAARAVMFYYFGITLGRFLSGIMANRISPRNIITCGSVCMSSAVLLLLFAQNPYLASIALFLIGLGNGPMFPNMVHLTPQMFGSAASSAMGFELASGNLGILLAPPLFGYLAEWLSVSLMPYYLLLFLVPLLISHFIITNQDKRV